MARNEADNVPLASEVVFVIGPTGIVDLTSRRRPREVSFAVLVARARVFFFTGQFGWNRLGRFGTPRGQNE